MTSFDEFVNRGRLFSVTPTFPDYIEWETIQQLEAMRRDFNRPALIEFDRYPRFPIQLKLFDLPWWEIRDADRY